MRKKAAVQLIRILKLTGRKGPHVYTVNMKKLIIKFLVYFSRTISGKKMESSVDQSKINKSGQEQSTKKF